MYEFVSYTFFVMCLRNLLLKTEFCECYVSESITAKNLKEKQIVRKSIKSNHIQFSEQPNKRKERDFDPNVGKKYHFYFMLLAI